MDKSLAERIIADNRRMHDSPGYAEFYDSQFGLVRNVWEQRTLRNDLAAIAAQLPPGFRSLDLGCGTGNLTRRLLGHGSHVTGFDLSAGMLDRLGRLAGPLSDRLELHCGEVNELLRGSEQSYHLVCMCSFLHHLPDYLETVRLASAVVRPGGFFYVAHEPLRRDRVDRIAHCLERIDFLWHRLEARTGIGGRVAREDPYYDPDNLADYWAMDAGLDEEAIRRRVRKAGFDVRLVRYDSKRHRILHTLGEILGTQHLFRLIAR